MRYDNRLRPRQKPNVRPAAWRPVACVGFLGLAGYLLLCRG